MPIKRNVWVEIRLNVSVQPKTDFNARPPKICNEIRAFAGRMWVYFRLIDVNSTETFNSTVLCSETTVIVRNKITFLNKSGSITSGIETIGKRLLHIFLSTANDSAGLKTLLKLQTNLRIPQTSQILTKVNLDI